MSDVTDMSTPVTRGELREELAQLERRFDHKLDMWGGALLARIEGSEKRLDGLENRFDGLENRFDRLENRFDGLEKRLEGMENRLLAEFARHAQAFQDAMAMQISVIDEKYKDLPARMNRVEADVEALKPHKPAARRPHARRRRGPAR